MFYYSKTTNAFYLGEREDNYKAENTWPADAKIIEDDTAVEFMQAPPAGKRRAGGDNGMPMWEDTPAPTHDEQVETADTQKSQLINQANAYMNSKQWPGKAAMGRLKDTEKAQYIAWLDYLDALEAVETSTAPGIDWPAEPTL